MSKWHLYGIPPIDDWTGWHHINRFSAGEDGLPDADWFQTVIPELAKAFKLLGWYGDAPGGRDRGWHLTAIPTVEPFESILVVAVKQDHGGNTFVASQVELPELDRAARECRGEDGVRTIWIGERRDVAAEPR